MIHRRSFLTVLSGLLLYACAETPTDVSLEDPQLPGAAIQAPAAGHKIVGSGHVQSEAGLREFTFHALEHPDGSVRGSYKVVLANGLFFEADVTCLAVEGSTGWVGGRIRATNAGAVVVGSTSMFYATDGGEGEGTTDIVSLAAFNLADGVDLQFCADRPLELPPLTVTDGNVQVR